MLKLNKKNQILKYSNTKKHKKIKRKDNNKKMGFPTDAPTSAIADKYQGVVIAEIACTLILYIVLRIIHFCIWGWLMSQTQEEYVQGIHSFLI